MLLRLLPTRDPALANSLHYYGRVDERAVQHALSLSAASFHGSECDGRGERAGCGRAERDASCRHEMKDMTSVCVCVCDALSAFGARKKQTREKKKAMKMKIVRLVPTDLF